MPCDGLVTFEQGLRQVERFLLPGRTKGPNQLKGRALGIWMEKQKITFFRNYSHSEVYNCLWSFNW